MKLLMPSDAHISVPLYPFGHGSDMCAAALQHVAACTLQDGQTMAPTTVLAVVLCDCRSW